MAVRIDGLTEAKATFDLLPPAFVEVASETIGTGTDIMWAEAYSRAPFRTGKLKQSIHRNVRADGLQAAVGSSDHIAKFVELGTNDTPAEPFLYPGFRIGARHIRTEMRAWADEAGMRARFRTKSARKRDVQIPSALRARFGKR